VNHEQIKADATWKICSGADVRFRAAAHRQRSQIFAFAAEFIRSPSISMKRRRAIRFSVDSAPAVGIPPP